MINCARGELIREPDLKAALDQGQGCWGCIRCLPYGTRTRQYSFSPRKRWFVLLTLEPQPLKHRENVAVQIVEQMSDFFLFRYGIQCIEYASDLNKRTTSTQTIL